MALSYGDKWDRNPNIKKEIARFVWERFIKEDDDPRIFIDAGSSTEAVAATITENLREGGKKPTVFTHNLGAWRVLSEPKDAIDLYLVGGRYNADLNANIEASGFRQQIEEWGPNIAIIAVSGVDSQGLWCSNIQDEHPVKSSLATKKVERRIIVCDHSKIGRTDVRAFSPLEHLTKNCGEAFFITDKKDWKQITTIRQEEYKLTLAQLKKEFTEEKVIEVDLESRTNPNDSPPPQDDGGGDSTETTPKT